jgi:sulfite reductase (NADPH) flavoprotein alpha-component
MIDLSLTKPVYNKQSPCLAKVKEKSLLTGPNSLKETYHISLDIKDTGLHFTPGDSLAIFPQNDPKLVLQALSFLGCPPEKNLVDPRSNIEMSALSYFSSKANLAKISSSLLKHLIELPICPEKKLQLSYLLEPENKPLLTDFIAQNDLIEVLSFLKHPPEFLDPLLAHLSPLLPRFYSISSSLKTHTDEVHLLVALASYTYKEETRYGVASHFLCNLATPGLTEVPLYVQPSKHFKLPENPDSNIIMIGPGTGVAPYRAFLQERIAEEATGKNWLFFGGRYQASDFLYGDLWTKWRQEGKLHLSTSFSRDQEQKEYVQHALLNQSKEIFRWLEGGAYFYVCGDAQNMAKDVEAALISLIQKEGSFSPEETKAYFKALKASKRYLTDVY